MAQVRVRVREADGRLPMVCMRCGEPATVTKTKNMSWFPPWVGVLILAGVLPYAIVAAILTKRAKVQAPFCEHHKWHYLIRVLFILGSLFAMLIVGVILIAIAVALSPPGGRGDNPAVGVAVCGSVGLFLLWVIGVVIMQNTAIRPKEITDTHIEITGVCDEFVEAVEESERGRRRSRSSRYEEEEDEEDEPRPRKRRARLDDDDVPRPRKGAESDAIKDEGRPRRKPPSDAFEE